jgi:hypothetical protein
MNTTIITNAQIRWIVPAPSKPPSSPASARAHGLSAKMSGSPVSAHHEREHQERVHMRSSGVKRR